MLTYVSTAVGSKDVVNDSVEALERFDFGGPPQWALVRGRRGAPVMLLVQAGPGFPMIQDADTLARELRLEDELRVVYWDQRGTGKSFHGDDREPISIERAADDVRAMVRALCARLDVTEVDVVGFSLGGSIALVACDDASLPVRSLTVVCPDVDLLASERWALEFALAEAERRGNQRALRALRAIGPAPHDDTKRFMERVKWVANFGGVHRRKTFAGLFTTTLSRLWSSPRYSIGEMIGALRGMGAVQERMLPALRGFELVSKPLRLRVPLAVFQGRHDAGAVPALSAELAARTKAELVWFEDSSHTPHEEEPAKFREELLRFVRGGRQAS